MGLLIEPKAVELQGQLESIARYLGRTFTTAGIDRYEDLDRDVMGFRFIGATHGNVEFTRELLATFESNENAVALELHLRHVAAEINVTPPGQRLIFTKDGLKREAAS